MTSTRRPHYGLILGSLILVLGFASSAPAQQQPPPPPPPLQRDDLPKIIRKSGGVLQGSATRRVEPAYPALAKAARISGSVVVEVTVDEEGNVIAARAISGHPLLKDAAVEAARGWTFYPTKLQDTPVKVIGTITFNFMLDHSAEIEELQRQLLSNPDSAELHYKVAELCRLDRKLNKAIAEYDQAITLQPDYVDAYIGLGASYRIAERYDEAVETYRQGLKVNSRPTYSEALHLLVGEAYLAQNRNNDALDEFKQAVAIKPDSADSHYRLGLTYVKLGDKQSAETEYTILKELNAITATMLRNAIDRMK